MAENPLLNAERDWTPIHRLEYQLTLDDYIDGLRAIYRLSHPNAARIRVLVLIVCLAAACLSFWAARTEPMALLVGAFYVGVLVLVVGRTSRRVFARAVRKSGVETGLPIVIELSEAGVVFTTQNSLGRELWAAQFRAEQDDTYILFFVSNTSARIIPRRAFASEAQAEAFFAFARAHLPRRDVCPQCGYSLRGNTTGVCSECGSTVQA